MENMHKKLTLIGAGPGDPELLTLKAYRIIEKSEVILYDNLVNREILDIAPTETEKIYVGKIPYKRFTHQDRIHELIDHYGNRNKSVVRLKGGDPFIFGRGFEELLFARRHGFDVQYVPGISSMQAIGTCGIPLTHRGVSDGVWAVTGTKSDHALSGDVALALQSRSTLVIYMGMNKLDTIATLYTLHGAGDTPAALVQEATTPRQKVVYTTASRLADAAYESRLTHPALIVIGEVTQLASLAAAQAHYAVNRVV